MQPAVVRQYLHMFSTASSNVADSFTGASPCADMHASVCTVAFLMCVLHCCSPQRGRSMSRDGSPPGSDRSPGRGRSRSRTPPKAASRSRSPAAAPSDRKGKKRDRSRPRSASPAAARSPSRSKSRERSVSRSPKRRKRSRSRSKRRSRSRRRDSRSRSRRRRSRSRGRDRSRSRGRRSRLQHTPPRYGYGGRRPPSPIRTRDGRVLSPVSRSYDDRYQRGGYDRGGYYGDRYDRGGGYGDRYGGRDRGYDPYERWSPTRQRSRYVRQEPIG